MASVPRFHLVHGQVAWAICNGQPPDAKTLDQLRYLRTLGVPFTEDELGIGRGNRLTYGYDHLIECGVAVWALRRGMKPRAVVEFLVGERTTLRKLYRRVLRDQPEGALEAPWVKSRGASVPTLANEYFIYLFKGYKEPGVRIEANTFDEAITFGAAFGDMVARVGHDVQPLCPLARLAIQLVARALVAPEPKRGPAAL